MIHVVFLFFVCTFGRASEPSRAHSVFGLTAVSSGSLYPELAYVSEPMFGLSPALELCAQF